MFLSPVRHFTHRGKPAVLRIIRRDGQCWAEVKTGDGERFSVQTMRDWYDLPDFAAEATALGAFKRRRGVEPSTLTGDPFEQ